MENKTDQWALSLALAVGYCFSTTVHISEGSRERTDRSTLSLMPLLAMGAAGSSKSTQEREGEGDWRVREKDPWVKQSLSRAVIWVETKAGGSCGRRHGHGCWSSGEATRVGEGLNRV